MTTRLVRSILAHARGTAHRSIPAVLTATGLIAACGIEYPSLPAGTAGSPNSQPGSLDPNGSAGSGRAGNTVPGTAGSGGTTSSGGGGGTAPGGATGGGGGAAGTPGGATGGSGPAGDAGAPTVNIDPNSCDTIKTQSRTILQTNCAGCHEAPNKQGTLDYILETDRLKSAGLLVPGSPETSLIYTRIAKGEMPPAGVSQRPTNTDATTIYQWIKVCTVQSPPADAGTVGGGGDGGGGSTGPGGPPAFIDNNTVARWVAADVTTLRLDDQPFQRYFSLVSLLNAGATAADMDLYRYGLAKAINATSQGTQIVIPHAIDQFRSVYRIDLRDVDWNATATRADKWEGLVAGNDFAVELVDDASTVTKQLTKTKVPIQSGTWFLHDGMAPPLYHDLLGIPTTLDALQRQLGVNVAQDIAQQDVWRSGFTHSGIAQLNRVIERHEIPAGGNRTFWISYDFAGNGGKENVFANPLDFQQDANEIIFNLPNGLAAYMLVDGVGNRLDEGNNHVVVDPSQRDGNVINGISCLGCHDKGIKFKPDEVRPFVDQSLNFDAQTKDKVDALYTDQAQFQALTTADANIFVQTVQRLSPPPTVTTEPVSTTFHKFDGDVDLTLAAAELGLTKNQLLTQLGRLDPSLSPLVNGTVQRDVFRAVFAQTVCLLKLGIANDPACGVNGSNVTGTSGTGGSAGSAGTGGTR